MRHLRKAAKELARVPQERIITGKLFDRGKFCPLGYLVIYYCRELGFPLGPHLEGACLPLEVADWFGVDDLFQIMVFRLNDHYNFTAYAVGRGILYYTRTLITDPEVMADYLHGMGTVSRTTKESPEQIHVERYTTVS